MSEAMFDKSSWNRAMGPALRVIGYLSAGYLLFALLFYILFFISSAIGIGELIVIIFRVIGPLVIIFYMILTIFKVLDEEMTRN